MNKITTKDIFKNFTMANSIELVTDSFRKYNLTFFIVTVAIGLMIAVFTLNNIIFTPIATEPSNTTSNNSSTPTLDQSTIQKINTMKTSTENSGDVTIPNGRTNPFAG